MSEVGANYTELKKEVVETRNQAIKTDNQIKNLVLDVKGFEKRFEVWEKRSRFSTLGVHLLVVMAVWAAAHVFYTAKTGSLRKERDQLLAERAEEKRHVEDRMRELNGLKGAAKAREELFASSEANALKFLQALKEGKMDTAVKLAEQIDVSTLTHLGKKLVGQKVQELRDGMAEKAYRAGRAYITAGRKDAAVTDLQKSLKLASEGRFATHARYYLASTLWSMKRLEEAVPLFEQLQNGESSEVLIEEVRYLLGTSLAKLGRTGEAKTYLQMVAGGTGQYAQPAKTYLASIANDAAATAPAATATQ
ncbi:MAG: tetratricopeptide repeat protein [Myxococcota bacterium]|nr:tetratricopeptide repeat protein [Myxococcota bacterium]